MISEDSILATTFTTSNLSSPNHHRGMMKQSRTLEVIPFNGLTDCTGDDEDEDDEEEESEDVGEEEEEVDGNGGGGGGGGELGCLEDGRSSSLHSNTANNSNSSPFDSTNQGHPQSHKQQQRSLNLNNENRILISSPSPSPVSPNSNNDDTNRHNNNRSPSVYSRMSSSVSNSTYEAAKIMLTPPAKVPNLNSMSPTEMNDILDQTSVVNCCPTSIPITSSWPNSAVHLSPATTTVTTTTPTTFSMQPSASPIRDQSINIDQSHHHHQLHRHQLQHHHHDLESIHHQHQQASHDNLQKVQHSNNVSNNTSSITTSDALNHNQDSFSHHQMLNHDNIGHHLTNNNGSLPPFCTL